MECRGFRPPAARRHGRKIGVTWLQVGQQKLDMFSINPEQRNFDLLEHRDAAPCIDQRDVLRRRDDDRAGQRRLLRHGELRIAGTGRQIDDENVEITSRHFA